MTRIRNSNDAGMEERDRRVALLEAGAPIGHSSVTRGALRVASEEGLIVQGSALVTGVLRTVGRIILEGLGILTVNGLIELFGSMRVGGGGSVTVEGGGDVVVNGGKIKAGNVEIRDGKIYVGTGGSQIVIDGATGKITAGNLTIDPSSNGGSIKFVGGPEVYAAGGQLGLYSTITGGYVTLDDGAGELHGPGVAKVSVSGSDFQFVGLQTVPLSEAPDGAFIGACIWDSSNRPRRVVSG